MAGGRRLRSVRGPELGDQVFCGRPDAARGRGDPRPRCHVTGFCAGLTARHGNSVGVCAIATTPQHATLASRSTAHANVGSEFPALTWVKVPTGGVAWPYVLSPQQATVESALTPHVCRYPALTCVNGPGGGVAWPYVLSPQHWSVPSILSPQASEPPALTSMNVPVGGVRFQQVSVLSVLRPQNEGDPATLT